LFSITLSQATRAAAPEEDPGLSEDYEIAVMEACELLAETDCEFRVRGFGSDWPVDVWVDLSTFMEDLPEVLEALRGSAEAMSDFYEQGIQRTLYYRPESDRVRIRCESRTDWVPDPDTEWVGRDELDRMLSDVAVAFARSLRLVSPVTAAREPFASWAEGRV